MPFADPFRERPEDALKRLGESRRALGKAHQGKAAESFRHIRYVARLHFWLVDNGEPLDGFREWVKR